jgi:hypothetical protein
MGALRASWPLACFFLISACGSARAWAGVAEDLVSGTEASWSGGLGTEQNDFFSLNGTVSIGNDDDPKAVTGDLHLSYTASFAPEDISVADSASKRLTSWVGGVSFDPWPHGFLGLDYDSTGDPFEDIHTEGLRISTGVGPVNFSYRMARTTIDSDFSVSKKTSYDGAFIYQQTLEAGDRIRLTSADTLSLSANVSFFDPDVGSFVDLLGKNTLSAIANLQTELQNFELWDVSAVYRRKWGEHWDSRLAAQFVHLVVSDNPLVIGTVEGGYHWNSQIYTKLGVQYSHDPLDHAACLLAEIRFTWDREPSGL